MGVPGGERKLGQQQDQLIEEEDLEEKVTGGNMNMTETRDVQPTAQSNTANPSNEINRLREERDRNRALYEMKHQETSTGCEDTQITAEELDRMTFRQECLEVEENLGFTDEEYWEII